MPLHYWLFVKKNDTSILSQLSANVICDAKSFCVLNVAPNVTLVPFATSALLSLDDEAIFAFGRSDGSIQLISMPKLETSGEWYQFFTGEHEKFWSKFQGTSSQDVLHHSSSIKRLWTGLVGQNDEGNGQKVVCLALQRDDDDVKLHVVYNDYKIRLWSCRVNLTVIFVCFKWKF